MTPRWKTAFVIAVLAAVAVPFSPAFFAIADISFGGVGSNDIGDVGETASDAFFARIDAPFVGDGFTRWVDGQYALDTPEAYEAFLDKHPDDPEYSPKARKHLERLSFEEARKQDTFQSYRQFLKKFPYGKYSTRAQQAAEDIRARELGIHLYRRQPPDFYDWVSSRRLPYRIMVRSSSPDPAGTRHLEGKWYSDLVRRGLFVPMDPQKTYRVSPDLTLYLRESVVILCSKPLALVEAEVLVRGNTVQTYRIAGDYIEQYREEIDVDEVGTVLQVGDGIARVAINRPRSLNALNADTLATVIPTTLGIEYRTRYGETSVWPHIGAAAGLVGFLQMSFAATTSQVVGAGQGDWTNFGFYVIAVAALLAALSHWFNRAPEARPRRGPGG